MLAQKAGGSIVTITALARNPIRSVTAAVPMITKGGLETITQRRPRAKATLLRLVIARLTSTAPARKNCPDRCLDV